ncbi:hypothetical protein AIZ11_24810, partial [Salmonella enterica subsp. enterica serovar Typhimurium]|uniref:hypothetical protein n=1 Tax=Salmonella enterica TaxID=28901 RepID=UPI000791AF0F
DSENVSLQTARFSLVGWMTLSNGEIAGGDVWLNEGGASWLGVNTTHTFSVDNPHAQISREQPGLQLYIPDTRITLYGKPWPSGAFT